MGVLEQILEEIEDRKSYHEELLSQRDDYEIQKMYCDEELNWIRSIIRSNMDEINTLEKKSVWEMDVMHHESYDLGRNVGWNECLETMQRNTNNSWIPVEERLPEEKGWYQCTCSDKEIWNDDIVRDLYYYPGIKEFVDNIRYETNGLKNIEKFFWTKYVTAWQQQPKPYKAKEKS